MHFSSFSSILFGNACSKSSSSPMQTSSSSSSSPAGFKNITEVSSSPSSNLNHPSMISRFNFRSSSSSSSSCSTSHSSPISLSPCSSTSSLMCGTNNDNQVVMDDEGELRFDRQISIRDQKSGIRRNFPPPIPSLARTKNLPCHMPWVLKRSYTEGRLVIKEVKVKHHEYFRAIRSKGRLVLKIMHMDANQLNLPKTQNPREEDQDVIDDDDENINDGVDAAEHSEQDEMMKQNIDHGVNDDDHEQNGKKDDDPDYVKDDDDDDDALSLSSSDEEEEEQFTAEEVMKVCVSSSSDHNHHNNNHHGLLRTSSSSSQLPSSSSFQPNQILEDEEGDEEEEEKQELHEVLRKKVRESMILASSMPEGSRVIGSCQPNNYKKSNLFRMPIASVRAVHS